MRAGFACILCLLLVAALSACGQVSTNVLSQPTTPDVVAPSITAQPADQTVKVGEKATFSVAAAGSVPLSYQWQRNSAAISGATTASYTTPTATVDNDGDSYAVMISNAAGSVASSTVRLSVAATAPAITSQPLDVSITAGQSATFSVVATGTAPVAYQWQKNGTAIAGASATSYTTPAETTGDNGVTFTVVVSNSAGTVTSSPAKLNVAAAGGPVAPSITVQPANQNVRVGQTATFTVAATGTSPLSYQWRRNGSAIAGATSASYTTAAAVSGDNGATFAVTVSNPAGSVGSRAASLTVSGVPPSLTSQPADQSIHVGQTATFTVAATGTAPLSYQWRRNGSAIAGATAASYATPAAALGDSGATFAVTVSNSAGSVTSRAALLTVTSAAPSISTQPGDQSIRAGQSATFTVTASGTAPLAYRWQKNGTAIAGATAASYTTPAETVADNGATFAVVVSNSAGSVTSRNAVLSVAAAVTQGTDVVTYKNDLARTGQNLTETTLTLSNVNSSTFGKLRFLSTDGKVDAQPLYLSALSVGGAAHNVVFVASEKDTVYAFDADSGAVLWKTSVLPAGETVNDLPSYACDQTTPTIGVTATPVIDRSAGAHGVIYLVAMSKEAVSGNFHHRLHALDVTTGAEMAGSPVGITATYPSSGGTMTFDAAQYDDRASLLLSKGTIYTSFTSHCDVPPYSGWIIAYNQTTLARTAVLNVAPNSGGVGPAIWMSGGGPAADSAGNVYLATANGAFETTLDASGFPNQQDYGNTVLKLSLSGSTLSVADYFTMSNEVAESAADLDLGSGGVMLLPDLTDSGGTVRHLAVAAGKDGNIYIVNRDSMGKFSASANNIWQQLTHVIGDGTGNSGGVWATPAYFNGTVYYGPNRGSLYAFRISNATLATSASSSSATAFGYPGTSPVISANGTNNGIVWTLQNAAPAALYAYDAANIGHQLYDSNQAANGRDQFGAGNKFIAPTVADGKVFVGTQAGVAVFGLLP
jgi:hypothetical protein